MLFDGIVYLGVSIMVCQFICLYVGKGGYTSTENYEHGRSIPEI